MPFTMGARFVGESGIEPDLYAPEAHVLPVYYSPTKKKKICLARACPSEALLEQSEGGYYHYTTLRFFNFTTGQARLSRSIPPQRDCYRDTTGIYTPVIL